MFVVNGLLKWLRGHSRGNVHVWPEVSWSVHGSTLMITHAQIAQFMSRSLRSQPKDWLFEGYWVSVSSHIVTSLGTNIIGVSPSMPNSVGFILFFPNWLVVSASKRIDLMKPDETWWNLMESCAMIKSGLENDGSTPSNTSRIAPPTILGHHCHPPRGWTTQKAESSEMRSMLYPPTPAVRRPRLRKGERVREEE